MRRMMTAVIGAVLMTLLTLSLAQAQGTTYDLRSAEFTLPPGWTQTHSSRDQSYDFTSPDGRYQLWARWWFPDEPLLGYDDIVRHEKRSLAGQEALFIHTEIGSQRMLQLAFLQEDAEGEIFLWQVSGTDVPLAEHEAMFDALLDGLVLNGKSASVAQATPTGLSPAPQTAPAAGQGAMYRDPEGVFALPLPDGWSVQTTTSDGLRQAVLVSPDRDAMLLATVAFPARGMTAAEVLDEHLGVIYRDSLVVKSIEDEAYPDIAGVTVHAVETVARVYAINGVAMTYPRGRVWIYRLPEGQAVSAPFLILTIRPEQATADLSANLERIAMGFMLDASAAPAAQVPLTADQVGTAELTRPDPMLPTTANTFTPGQPALIFDGRDLSGLVPLAFDSAQFDTDATLRDDALVVTIGSRKGWANLGFATPVPVLTLPARTAKAAQRITAILDADQSTGITFALTPADKAAEAPEKASDLRVQLRGMGDGQGTLELIQRDPKLSQTVTFPWPSGEAVLHLLLRPDQRIELRDGTGTQLAEVAPTGDFAGRSFALQTYVQGNAKNSAAALVLRRLSVDTVPFDPAPDLDAIAEGPRTAILFDGFALDRAFGKVSRGQVSGQAAEVARFITLRDGALRVHWRPEDGGSWTGIATPEAVLWLDRFTGAAEARIELALVGGESKDFQIALQSSYALPGNLSDNGSYVLRFTGQADGTYTALSALRSREKEGLTATGLTAIPDRVTLVLTPAGVRVEGAGLPDGVLPFAQLQDGVGLRIAIHALATAQKDGALVLRGVRIVTRPGDYPAPPAPATDLAPLPQTVLFDTRPDAGWDLRNAGKADFAMLAHQGVDGLTLTRRDPVPDWNRIALVGTAPVVDLDYRIGTTPFELTFTLDPGPRIGTRIFLHTSAANFEDAAKVAVYLRALTEGPDAGGLEVQLYSGHFSYQRWRRVLPAGQWRADWDGTVRLRLGPDWVALGLGRDWLMRGFRQSSEFMLAITPGGRGKTESGDVTLHQITGGWVTPDGMTGTERLRLSDTADFDPDLFLDMLATETGVSTP